MGLDLQLKHGPPVSLKLSSADTCGSSLPGYVQAYLLHIMQEFVCRVGYRTAGLLDWRAPIHNHLYVVVHQSRHGQNGGHSGVHQRCTFTISAGVGHTAWAGHPTEYSTALLSLQSCGCCGLPPARLQGRAVSQCACVTSVCSPAASSTVTQQLTVQDT